MIKCAHCKGKHETVSEVRECSGTTVMTLEDAGAELATIKQVGYITMLMEKKEVPTSSGWPSVAILLKRADDVLGGKMVTKQEATEVIAYLVTLAWKEQAADKPEVDNAGRDVPAGRYALGSDEAMTFYQVDRPGLDSQWAGHVFINRLVGAPGDFARYRIRGSERTRVLNMIAEDPKAASLRYGQNVGECGVCHSPLTNESSRAAGIGPVCAAKKGW